MKTKKLTQHEKEMEILKEHHKKVMADPELRAKTLIDAGIFYRKPDGTLEVVDGYKSIFQ